MPPRSTAAAPGSALYRVELFGPVVVRRPDNSTITRFRSEKTASLLAYLAYHAGRPQAREVLADMFWPESSASAGRVSLTAALTSLRAQLEPPGVPAGSVIVANRANIGLSTATVTTDAAEFEGLLDEAKSKIAAGQHDPDLTAILERAIGMYSGTFVAGLYQPWIVPAQERLTARWWEGMVWLAREAERSGDRSQAIQLAQRAQIESQGYCDAAQELLDRLDGPPFDKRTASHLTPRSTASNTVTGEKPSAKEPETPTPPPRLALPLAPFFGRQSDIHGLRNRLLYEQVRLITLVGVGGVGKTRLARELMESLRTHPAPDEPPRTLFAVDLTGVRRPEEMPETIASGIGINVQEMRAGGGDIGAAIVDHLRSAHEPVLLIDNIEQLLPPAGDWIYDILQQVGDLSIIATSRVRIDVAGEFVYELEPLAIPLLPDPDRHFPYLEVDEMLKEYPSVALFVERAQRVRADFRLTRQNIRDVGRLVNILEGIPLALELAAARSQVLTPKALLERMPGSGRLELLQRRGRGEGDRHRSLRAAIAWSVDFLSPELRRAFARLAVFRGGWKLEAAEAVLESETCLDDLAQLCEVSLIRAVHKGDGSDDQAETTESLCFTVLETIREYAAELLQAEPAHAHRAATLHGEYYATLATESISRIQSQEQARAIASLRVEEDNLHAAMERASGIAAQPSGSSVIDIALDRINPGLALRLGAALFHYWSIDGHIVFGHAALTEAIKHRKFDGAADKMQLCRAATAAGSLAWQLGKLREARLRYRQALWLTRLHDPDNARRRASLWNNMGILADEEGRYAEARRWCTSAIRIWRQNGESWYLASSLLNLGEIAERTNDLAEAETCFTEAIELARSDGNDQTLALALSNFGVVRYRQGNLDDAIMMCAEGLKTATRMRFEEVQASGLMAMGIYLATRGAYRNGKILFDTGDHARRASGRPIASWLREKALDLGLFANEVNSPPLIPAPTTATAPLIPLQEAILLAVQAAREVAPQVQARYSENFSITA